jgi:hypothetical protein
LDRKMKTSPVKGSDASACFTSAAS